MMIKEKMRNSFKILFYVKKNKPKKNGYMTIMIRVTVNGEQTQFTSNLEIQPELWDQRLNRAIGRTECVQQINQMLIFIQTELYRHYIELSYTKIKLTPIKIKNAYLGKNVLPTIISVFKDHNQFCKRRIGKTMNEKSVQRYEVTFTRLLHFLNDEYRTSDILLHEITVSVIEKFHLFLLNTYQCSHNTAMKYIQRFAVIMNYAERNGLLEKNPFMYYRIKFENIDAVFLTQSEVDKLWNKKFATKRIQETRDIFVFSCYTGLSYSDIVTLKLSHIVKSFDEKYWIILHRHKTGKPSHIPLLKISYEIMKKYRCIRKEGYLFPVRSNQKTNEYLKEIADVCGIDKKLTSHVARHTFATLALNYGVSLESLSRMLGHTSIKTTQLYARITDRKIKKEMSNMQEGLNSWAMGKDVNLK